ncbi:MAG: TOBE domain-containing protein, partial [Cellulomonadaceae bacterium]|nr:TOBE domain-containing protein [Cellulomonadaceae bacterium]
PVIVNIVEELGSDAFVYGSLTNEFGAADAVHSGAGDAQIIVRVDPRQVPLKGDTIWVTIRPGERHVFSSSTGARINV